MRLPTASSLTRAMKCPASCVLPGADRQTPAGTKGDVVHRFIRRARDVGRDAALAEIDQAESEEGYYLAETPDVDALPTGGSHEITFAWDSATDRARVLGQDLGRDYSGATATEFVGTADFAGSVARWALIVDWKTGWWAGPARDSWQLRLLALAAARTMGLPAARVAHAVLRDDGLPRWDMLEFDEMALDAIAGELMNLRDRLLVVEQALRPGLEPQVFEGEWCHFCPAWVHCPAHVKLAVQMVRGLEVVDGQLPAWPNVSGPLTPEMLGQALQLLDKVQTLHDRIYAECEKYIAEHEITVPMPDGRIYALAAGAKRDKVVNQQLTFELLSEHFGQDIALLAMTATKKSIGDAVRVWARREKKQIGVAQTDFLAQLRRAGAIEKAAGEVKVRLLEAHQVK